MSLDVVGVGNAIMDALVRIPDEGVLDQLGLARGRMTPADHSRWHQVYDAVHTLGVEIHSGGSCANVVATSGVLGARALFCGQVGDDLFGNRYGDSMEAACGAHALQVAEGKVSGKCLSLISKKDGERTMLTDLGTSVDLTELGDFAERIRHAKVLHLEGYGLLGGPVKQTVYEAMDVAKQANVAISLDCADPFVARACKDELIAVFRSQVDIGFFNREEAEILTGKEAHEAIEELGSWVSVAVVKLGAEGSLVRASGQTFRIPVFPTQVLDTTGAGDSYAGAFLYAWTRGLSLDKCGELGSRVAALTVGQVGAVVRDRAAMARAVAAVSA